MKLIPFGLALGIALTGCSRESGGSKASESAQTAPNLGKD